MDIIVFIQNNLAKLVITLLVSWVLFAVFCLLQDFLSKMLDNVWKTRVFPYISFVFLVVLCLFILISLWEPSVKI